MPAESFTLYAKWTLDAYTITFETNGGSSVDSITEDFGESISAPTAPSRTGYTFDDWYEDETLTTPYAFDTMPDENLTLYAGWDALTYTITFKYYVDGPTYTTLDFETGELVELPAEPDDYGDYFSGWFEDEALESAYTAEPMLAEDFTLYGKWSKSFIEFDSNGGSEVDLILGDPGDPLSDPTDPIKANHQFNGWYEDPSLTTEFDFDTIPETPITLYADWLAYMLIFDTGEGEPVDAIGPIYPGSIVLQPTAPIRTGYTFAGWFEDEARTIAFDWFAPINDDYILYAAWEENEVNEVTVIFNSGEGTYIPPVQLEEGEFMTEPVTPMRDGYEFTGWYTNAAQTAKWIFTEDTVSDDLTLYAGWDEITLTAGEQALDFIQNYGIMIAILVVVLLAIIAFFSPRKKWRRRKYRW